MPKLIDNVYAARMAALLYLDWNKWEAFKLGIIDKNGEQLKKATTGPETTAWTYFHRLAANIKRMIESIPGGKSKIGKLVAAYALYREDTEDEILFNSFDENKWMDAAAFIQEDFSVPMFRDFIKP